MGCVGAQVPTDRLASAEAAIRTAREVSAERTSPQGALHLQLAREQLDAAKRLVADGDMKRAEWVLRRAEADAELALQMAREERAKAAAEQTLEDVTLLKAGGGQ